MTMILAHATFRRARPAGERGSDALGQFGISLRLSRGNGYEERAMKKTVIAIATLLNTIGQKDSNMELEAGREDEEVRHEELMV